MTPLLVIAVLSVLIPGIQSKSRVLESERVSNFGEWGPWTKCPEGSYAMGFQLKVQEDQYYGDDIALNGIRLICATFLAPMTSVGTVQSSAGSIGAWRNEFFCDTGFINGFELRAYPPKSKANEDNFGATSLKVFCSNLGKNPIEGDGLPVGDFSKPLMCKKYQAICGLRTQVDNGGLVEDDVSGLNNVDMMCCDIPNPGKSCTPTDTYVDLVTCDNLGGIKDSGADYYLNCTYEQTVGVSMTSSSSCESFDEMELSGSLGFSVVGGLAGFTANIMTNLDQGSTIGVKWSKASQQTFSEEVTAMAFFTVPPGLKVKLQQATATCGTMKASSTNFRKLDFKKPVSSG